MDWHVPRSRIYALGGMLATATLVPRRVVWFGAWLFTLGFLHLHFWKGVLAILLWPYYLGVTFSSLLPH